jgi:hypothetical protein
MLKYISNTGREVVDWIELRYSKVHGRILGTMAVKNRILLQKTWSFVARGTAAKP